MGLITNEQEEKRPNQFLKLDDKSKLTILSNLYKMDTHFLKDQNKSVLCFGEGKCKLCASGQDKRVEYYYLGTVNGDQGIVRIPSSVFFALNQNENLLEIDKRDVSWIIGKTGEGLSTKYQVVRGNQAPTPEVSVEDANTELVKVMDKYKAKLEEGYQEETMFDEVDTEVEKSVKKSEEIPF